MKSPEKYYREVNCLSVYTTPELGEGDKFTIDMMEGFAKECMTKFKRMISLISIAISIITIIIALIN